VTVRIGAKLPNSGPLPETIGIGAMARALESAGFESAWVSDHIVMPAAIGSQYPFAVDGRATWSPETPYLDALIALALAAGTTDRVRLGTAVLVLPLRNPVELAKQAASIDVASGGRLELGVGAGWLREEFDALNAPFARRGARLEEWMHIARACWTGRPGSRRSEWYELPDDVVSLPTPAHEIPLLVGGHSRAALERAGRVGDGWLAQQALPELAPAELRDAAAIMRAAAKNAGRDPDGLRVVLRIVESAGSAEGVARALPELAAAGVDEIIVDVPWDDGGPPAAAAALREAAAA
jgi:probable F420-dependent oxidoreductase